MWQSPCQHKFSLVSQVSFFSYTICIWLLGLLYLLSLEFCICLVSHVSMCILSPIATYLSYTRSFPYYVVFNVCILLYVSLVSWHIRTYAYMYSFKPSQCPMPYPQSSMHTYVCIYIYIYIYTECSRTTLYAHEKYFNI